MTKRKRDVTTDASRCGCCPVGCLLLVATASLSRSCKTAYSEPLHLSICNGEYSLPSGTTEATHLDYGLDISIFANGLPDTRSAGAQRLARPALDLTLSTISDRDVLILDLYKLQFTPPELVFWSQDQNGEPSPITINLPDLLQDTVDRNTIADVASQIETTVLADARFADIRIETVFTGTELTITETVLPTDGTAPIELVVNSTGSAVTLVRAG